MNIVLVSLQFQETSTGGGGVHVENICEWFLKLGHGVTILSIHTNKTLKGVELKEESIPYSIQIKDKLTTVRFLINKDIDHPYVGDKDTELNRIKRFSDAVIEWLKTRQDGFDVINLHGHHIITGYIPSKLQGIKPKIISTVHALESTYIAGEDDFIGAFDGTKEVLGKIRDWEAMARFADYIIVNSQAVSEEFKKIILEFDQDISKYENKIILISSGCGEDFLMSDEDIKDKLKNPPDVINLVSFCRVDPSKGLEFAINGAKYAASKSNYKFCLTIAGIPSSVDYIKQLKRQTSENMPNNLEVKFKLFDRISPIDEKKQILDDKHIYILSTLKEPFGMSIIEASAEAI